MAKKDDKKNRSNQVIKKIEGTSAREEALKAALDVINKKYGEGSVMKFGEKAQRPCEVLPTGIPSIDLALGVGGFPKGRIVELYGSESSGKTTLALYAIARLQKEGGTAAFIDAEHALDPNYAAKLGVDMNALLVAQPDFGEEGLEITEALVRSGTVDLIVVDSVAALVPKNEIDGGMGDATMGMHARLMSQALRKLTGAIAKSQCIVIFLNQLRDKMGIAAPSYGPNETTTGGRALRFYASVRAEVKRGQSLKSGNDIKGNIIKFSVRKNKMAPPFRVAEVDLIYGKGIDIEKSMIESFIAVGLFKKSGSWYSYKDEKLGQGVEKVVEKLKKDDALYQRALKEFEALIQDPGFAFNQMGAEASTEKLVSKNQENDDLEINYEEILGVEDDFSEAEDIFDEMVDEE